MEAEPRATSTRPDTADVAAAGELERASAGSATAAGVDAVVTPHERCVHHPGKSAVARCEACEEPLCLVCAVPVRGRVLGTECLAAELGDPALTVPPEPGRRVGGSRWAAAGAVLALLATAGPWTRTGAGDRLFGAWVPSLRWSMVAALAALVLVAAAWWLLARRSRAAEAIVLGGGVLVAGASALAIAYPPTFQEASWAPWVAAAGAAIAVGSAIAGRGVEHRPTQGV